MKTMSEQQIKYYKENFPAGTRVQLDRMGDDPNPIPKGTKGVVSYVDDLALYSANLTTAGVWECVPKWIRSM